MNCPHCGHERLNQTDTRCSHCGQFYSKLFELIAEEEAYEYEHSWQGRWQRFSKANSKKQALFSELKIITANWSLMTWFSVFVVFTFVFALIVIVL